MTSHWESLFRTDQLPDLGPGPRSGVLSESALEVMLAEFFRRHPAQEPQKTLLKALALLWHDHLAAAHTLAQGIDTPDGAFVHGIVHRREPDYGNAAYWFRRVGRHAAFAELTRQASSLLATPSGHPQRRELLPNGRWDPFAFITVCERVAGRPVDDAERKLVRDLQRIESQVLFDHFAQEV
jgi:hypothetical protein